MYCLPTVGATNRATYANSFYLLMTYSGISTDKGFRPEAEMSIYSTLNFGCIRII